MDRPLRIGTRGSQLARAQAAELVTRLADTNPDLAAPEAIEIVVIRTTGDQVQDRPLTELGGKGAFTKEIDEALLAGTIDLAVHSGKDMPTQLPPGLMLVCCLTREDPREAFFSPKAPSLAELPQGARIGTGSPRRAAQLLHLRPDLKIVPFRGNVGTRLRKLYDGEADATILALAGLKRLGLADKITSLLSLDEMLPAPAQGAIGITAREDNDYARQLLALVDDPPTTICVSAERAFLATLDGSCRTPIAALAQIAEDGSVQLRGMVIRPDGSERLATSRHGHAREAVALGIDAGQELRSRAGPGYFTAQGGA